MQLGWQVQKYSGGLVVSLLNKTVIMQSDCIHVMRNSIVIIKDVVVVVVEE